MANKEEEKILKITVRYDDALEGIKKYKKEIEGLNEAEKELNKADEDYAEELELIKAQRKEAEAQIRVLRKEIQNNIKIEREQEGSLKQLRAALSNATKEYDEMSKAERESAKGVELKNHINDITKELKGAEEETQRFYRNVGNYKNSIVEALGLNQGFAGSLMSMADGADDASGMITNMGSSLKAFGASCLAMLTNPVFLAIAGIAGAGIAFKWWYDYNKGIEEATRKTKALFGTLSGDELKEYRVNIQSIADMYNKEFVEVLTAVNTLVKQFGIDGKTAVDLIADGFHLDADLSGQFLENVKEFAPQFKAAGVEADEFIAMLSNMEKEGVFGNKAMDSIKEATLRIREMPQATRDALEGIGMDVDKMQEKLNNGSVKIIDVIKLVSTRLKDTGVQTEQIGAVIADVFGGAGEDAGLEFLSTINNISTSLSKAKTDAGLFYENNQRVLASTREYEKELALLFDATGGSFETMTADIKIFMNESLAGILRFLNDIKTTIVDFDNRTHILSATIKVVTKAFEIFFTNMYRGLLMVIDTWRLLVDITQKFGRGDFEGIADAWKTTDSKLKANWDKMWDAWTTGWSKAKDEVKKGVEEIEVSTSKVAKKIGWGNWLKGLIDNNSIAKDKAGIEEEIKTLTRLQNRFDLTAKASDKLTEAINKRKEALAKVSGGGGGNKSPLDKEIEKEYQTRQDQIEKEAEIIRKRLEFVKYEAEERYRIKMELLEKEKQLEIMRITEEYTNEVQRNEALRLLDLEYAQKAKELEKEKSDVLLNEALSRAQGMMDIVTQQTEHERKNAEEQKKIEQSKVAALTTLTHSLSALAQSAAEDNEQMAKLAKALAIAEIMIAQGVAIANAVKKATASGATIWDTISLIGVAIGAVTSVMATALKSVNSAKIGGSGSAGGSGASSMTYTSSAMYNPMLAQLNSVGDNMMPYESRMRDEGMNEEMMTDAVTRGVQNQPAPVVSVVEITETQNRVKAIESMSDV